jgi:hypothetical protein
MTIIMATGDTGRTFLLIVCLLKILKPVGVQLEPFPLYRSLNFYLGITMAVCCGYTGDTSPLSHEEISSLQSWTYTYPPNNVVLFSSIRVTFVETLGGACARNC